MEGMREDMPEAVAVALNAVMTQVKRLLKTEKNSQAGYRFASIDDFLAAVNPLCAQAGLIILQDELDARLVNNGTNASDRSWLWSTYEFTLAHKSGALYGPLTRSIMVPAEGAQAFGAAQSYALKQFMRSLFQIPTGDREDADFGVPRRLPGHVRRGSLSKGNGAALTKNRETNAVQAPEAVRAPARQIKKTTETAPPPTPDQARGS